MSRIGRKPIPVPEAVTVEVAPGRVAVKGPKGELEQSLSPEMTVEKDDGAIVVKRPTDRGEHRALHGLTRSLIANMVEGEPPEGIEFEVPQPTEIVVRGIDKQLVGQVAADIRKRRPPEPYKGKGIRYRDEHVMRKVGKRA
jgi:large subunit ribosomal protein L6